MSVYIIDKCERFVSQRAGCGKAASPDSVRGVRPQGVRLLDPLRENKLSKESINIWKAKKAKADAKAAEEAKKTEAEAVLKKLLASGMSADEILEKLK